MDKRQAHHALFHAMTLPFPNCLYHTVSPRILQVRTAFCPVNVSPLRRGKTVGKEECDMDPFAENPRKLDDTFLDWTAPVRAALRQAQRRPLHAHARHPHERHGVRGQLVLAPVFPPLRRQRAAPPDSPASAAANSSSKSASACSSPPTRRILEHTIGYEQLAVDLTAALAQTVGDGHVKKALDFALLEDFDHLYRYADLLDMETQRQGGGHRRPLHGDHARPPDHRPPPPPLRFHQKAHRAAKPTP